VHRLLMAAFFRSNITDFGNHVTILISVINNVFSFMFYLQKCLKFYSNEIMFSSHKGYLVRTIWNMHNIRQFML
jgi:hypothetical protein